MTNKLSTVDLNAKSFEYILNAIDGEGYGKTLTNDSEKLAFLDETFRSEYGHMINRIGYTNAMREWLMGLPSSFNVAFENYRIIQIAKEWGSLPENATDKQEDKIIDNWFNLIANKTTQLMKRNKIPSLL